MLVLERKNGESIQIGSDIRIHVFRDRRARLKIGIEAPPDVPVVRAELLKGGKRRTR